MTINKITNAPTPNEQIDKINEIIQDTNSNTGNISTLTSSLSSKENTSNKTNSISSEGSTTLYPTTKAVVDYVAQSTGGSSVPAGTVIQNNFLSYNGNDDWLPCRGVIIPEDTDLYSLVYNQGFRDVDSYYKKDYSICTLNNTAPFYAIPVYEDEELGMVAEFNGIRNISSLTTREEYSTLLSSYFGNGTSPTSFQYSVTVETSVIINELVAEKYIIGTSRQYIGFLVQVANTSGAIKIYAGDTRNTTSWNSLNGITTGITIQANKLYKVKLEYVYTPSGSDSVKLYFTDEDHNVQTYTATVSNAAGEIPVCHLGRLTGTVPYLVFGNQGYTVNQITGKIILEDTRIEWDTNSNIKVKEIIWKPLRYYSNKDATALHIIDHKFCGNAFGNTFSNNTRLIKFTDSSENNRELYAQYNSSGYLYGETMYEYIPSSDRRNLTSIPIFKPVGKIYNQKSTTSQTPYVAIYDIGESTNGISINTLSLVSSSYYVTDEDHLCTPLYINTYMVAEDTRIQNPQPTYLEGLPDHNHSHYALARYGADGGTTGAFWGRGDSGAGYTTGYFTNASSSNDIYGRSSHVRPNSVFAKYFIKT